MKTILFTIILILGFAKVSNAQLERIVFTSAKSVTMITRGDSTIISSETPCLDVITFQKQQVIYYSHECDTIQVLVVVSISGRTKKQQFYWQCANRTFLLNISRGSVLMTTSLVEQTFYGKIELQ